VFGVIDRDYRPTNRPNRTVDGKTFRRFILPVHDVENYLLDSEALSRSRLNTRKLTPQEIENDLTQAAEGMTWWAACREVVAELRRMFRDNFVLDPPCGTILDEAVAVNHICNSDWFRKLAEECGRTTAANVRALLTVAHLRARSNLADGSWRVELPRKEIYRDVGSRICDRTALSGYRPTPTQFDIDLAKQVGAWQADNNRVLPDLSELLGALRRRIERVPNSPQPLSESE
jgi:hypothetical protein